MSGLKSLNKGKRAERECVKILQPLVDKACAAAGIATFSVERNLTQSRKGGFDIAGIPWLALEVKHHETEQLSAWWEQAKRQAAEHQEPVLFHRKNHGKWKVRMFGYLNAAQRGVDGPRIRCPVDISLETFLVYFQVRLERSLTEQGGG